MLKQRTSLFFDGVDQMDVVLRHQCDGHTIPPCRGRKETIIMYVLHVLLVRHEVIAGKLLEKRKKATCSRCPSDSVDVDLGETGGVVVDDHLDRWNIQAPVEQERGQKHGKLSPLRQIFMQLLTWLPRLLLSEFCRRWP